MAILARDTGPLWPPTLAEFDPARWPSEAEWHLARAHAAPDTLSAINEIRAAVGRPALGI